MKTVKITRKQAEPVLKASFPEYRGRTIRVDFSGTVCFHDTNWGDGSRNYYHGVKADGTSKRMVVPAPWVNPVEGKTMLIPSDVLIVEHSIFCGHDCGITIYAHPQYAPKWLTA